jgi:hypothetical protein
MFFPWKECFLHVVDLARLFSGAPFFFDSLLHPFGLAGMPHHHRYGCVASWRSNAFFDVALGYNP